jgi:hypothetical protein
MTREVLIFLFEAAVISLSGVLAPGPVTAAALAAGSSLRGPLWTGVSPTPGPPRDARLFKAQLRSSA